MSLSTAFSAIAIRVKNGLPNLQSEAPSVSALSLPRYLECAQVAGDKSGLVLGPLASNVDGKIFFAPTPLEETQVGEMTFKSRAATTLHELATAMVLSRLVDCLPRHALGEPASGPRVGAYEAECRKVIKSYVEFTRTRPLTREVGALDQVSALVLWCVRICREAFTLDAVTAERIVVEEFTSPVRAASSTGWVEKRLPLPMSRDNLARACGATREGVFPFGCARIPIDHELDAREAAEREATQHFEIERKRLHTPKRMTSRDAGILVFKTPIAWNAVRKSGDRIRGDYRLEFVGSHAIWPWKTPGGFVARGENQTISEFCASDEEIDSTEEERQHARAHLPADEIFHTLVALSSRRPETQLAVLPVSMTDKEFRARLGTFKKFIASIRVHLVAKQMNAFVGVIAITFGARSCRLPVDVIAGVLRDAAGNDDAPWLRNVNARMVDALAAQSRGCCAPDEGG